MFLSIAVVVVVIVEIARSGAKQVVDDDGPIGKCWVLCFVRGGRLRRSGRKAMVGIRKSMVGAHGMGAPS